MIKVDWFLRIGLQDKDFIINVDWSEGKQKELLSDYPKDKKEVIKTLKKVIKFIEGD